MDKLSPHIEEDRYKNRRSMAWKAFWLIALVGIPITAFGLSSDVAAKRVDSMSFMLGTLFGVWVAIVLAYFGAATITDRTEITTANKKGNG